MASSVDLAGEGAPVFLQETRTPLCHHHIFVTWLWWPAGAARPTCLISLLLTQFGRDQGLLTLAMASTGHKPHGLGLVPDLYER